MKTSQISNLKFQISKGFTLIELGLTMGIFSTLVGIATISLIKVQSQSTSTSVVELLIADLKTQQLRAMVGDTAGKVDGSGNPLSQEYSIHFENNSYTLFSGTTYSTMDASNFKVDLPNNLNFVPVNPNLTYVKGSGEIATATNLVLRNTNDGSQKTIILNKYGVVTGVNK